LASLGATRGGSDRAALTAIPRGGLPGPPRPPADVPL